MQAALLLALSGLTFTHARPASAVNGAPLILSLDRTDRDAKANANDLFTPSTDVNSSARSRRTFSYQGQGECRQGDGQYPLKFSAIFSDLTPHTEGSNAATATVRCKQLCSQNSRWCLAAEVVTRDVWPSPDCRLVTDRATFEAAGNTLQNNRWGGAQLIDDVSYQTYCGGNGACDATSWAGGTLYPRAGYHCYHSPPDPTSNPTSSPTADYTRPANASRP